MTMKIYFGILFLISFTLLTLGNAYQEDSFLDGQITLIVEDSLEDSENPVFTPRSNIYIRSIKSGIASITHTREWTDNLSSQLKMLADNDGLYRIKVYPEHDPKNYVSTFTKACLMYESRLSEAFSLMIDPASAALVGASIFTKERVCQRLQVLALPPAFNTTILTRSFVGAPIPDTATYIQKIEAIKTEKAEEKDNKSFFGKYWMYMIPMVVVLVLISSGQQEGPTS